MADAKRILDDKTKKEFDEFIDSGECEEAITAIVELVQLMFPDDIRKQGVSIAAANEYFKWAYGPKVASRH